MCENDIDQEAKLNRKVARIVSVTTIYSFPFQRTRHFSSRTRPFIADVYD